MPDPDLVETKPGPAPARDAAFSPPERYRVVERLGEGGMGVVWAAHDTLLDRPVALKLLHDRFLGADHQARLAGEARAMARLHHPNVVAVYDVGEHAGRTFLTMELVRGIDLGRWLEQPRSWREIADVFRAAARGLAAAHAAGIVHRDIKPSNILVGERGEVRVADFGVAHASVGRPDAGAAPSALTAGMIGTPAYMAPEQLRGEPSDARADQFALCASLYEALHGRRPFTGDSVAELLAATERGCPPPVRSIPRWLHAAVARGLAYDPAARFASMDALVAALASRRRQYAFVAAAAVVVAGGGLATVLALRGGGASCDARGALAGVWDAPVADHARAAFAALGTAYAPDAGRWLVARLDADAAAWTRADDDACRDRDDGKRACLAAHRAVLAKVSARLATPDAALVEDPPAALAELPALAECSGDTTRAHVRELIAVAMHAYDDGDSRAVAATTAEALRLAAGHVDDSALLPLLHLYTRAALHDGRLSDALAGSKRAVDAAKLFGEHHPAYGRAEALAAAYNLQAGRLDKARAKASTALRVARDAHGEDHADVADAHALLAAIADKQGDRDTAAAELRAADAIRARLSR